MWLVLYRMKYATWLSQLFVYIYRIKDLYFIKYQNKWGKNIEMICFTYKEILYWAITTIHFHSFHTCIL